MMVNTLSSLYQTILQQNSTLIDVEFNHHLSALVNNAPQNIKSLCLEFKADGSKQCDLLLSYQSDRVTMQSLADYCQPFEANPNGKKLIDFLEHCRALEHDCPIPLFWFSFDWLGSHFSPIPTFYYSTNHRAFYDLAMFKQHLIGSCGLLAAEFSAHAVSFLTAKNSPFILDVGFTFPRTPCCLKLGGRIKASQLSALLSEIQWSGNDDKLQTLFNTFGDLLKYPRIGISYQQKLVDRIEIELPWITNSDNNYINDDFINKLGQLGCAYALDGTALSNWYGANENAGLYLKLSLAEDSTLSLKAYLHILAEKPLFNNRQAKTT
ncbi:MAG: hypothetical protein ACI8WB_002262 [Phenylobacterium sp.]|jgi:hypothetical protein